MNLETLNKEAFVEAITGEVDFETLFAKWGENGMTDPDEQQERRDNIGSVIGHFHDRLGAEAISQMIKFNDNQEKKLDGTQAFIFAGFATPEMLSLLQNGMENKRPDIFPMDERIDFSDVELGLMLKGGLSVLAKNTDELWNQYDLVKQRLLLSPADISLKGQWREGAYEGEEAINIAIAEGRLQKVNNKFGMLDGLESWDPIQTNVDPRLVTIVDDLYTELEREENADIREFFDFSSGTRDFRKQRLLKKLGYPAAGLSFHNFGEAIDIKVKEVNDEDKTKWEKAKKLAGIIQSLGTVDMLDESEFFGRPVYHLQVKAA